MFIVFLLYAVAGASCFMGFIYMDIQQWCPIVLVAYAVGSVLLYEGLVKMQKKGYCEQQLAQVE